MDCVICFNQITKYNQKTLKCGHRFHFQCIKDWIEFSHKDIFYSCPTCRHTNISINKKYRNNVIYHIDNHMILFLFLCIGYLFLFFLINNRFNGLLINNIQSDN